MRRVGVVAALVVLAAAGGYAAGVNRSAPAAGPPGTGRVIRVVDGDTAHIMIGGEDEAVRFIGVDTPETHGRGGLRECFGAEATKRTESLIPPGTEVRLVRDVESRDRYGRLLAYVYRQRDGLFVNLALARDGYAVPLTIAPNVAHTDEFVAAAREAREADRGLWSRCGGADTPIP
jgi:micrococcal nuclease